MTCRPTCIQPSPSNAHCGAHGCHQTFGSVSAFDRHRRNGVCLSPLAIGLRADRKGVWRYPAPDPTKAGVWPQSVHPAAEEA